MEYISITNWEKFQHYKNRNPPWVKIHQSILRDYEFCHLSDINKSHLMLLWVLASQMENKIPNDPKWIQEQLSLEKKIDLQTLMTQGWVQSASNVLASCYQNADSETETETETETEYTSFPDVDFGKPKTLDCPHKDIINLYHETLPELARVKVWNDARKVALRARWREDEKRQTLDYWQHYFEYVGGCDFLMGRVGKWKANLEWLINPSNFVKVIENNYANRKQASC